MLHSMAKAFIQLSTKNGSLLGDRIEIETDIVPRVGELIDGWAYLKMDKGDVGDFMVESVIYKLTREGFAAYISARQWYKGLRHDLLKERGWLVPDDIVNMSYDEDDHARLEPVKKPG